MFQYSEKFQGKGRLFNILKDKKYIQYGEFRAHYFSGQAQVAQNSWKIKNISIQWKIPGQILFFKASAGCSKFWMIKNVYSI